jgi:hypothetical protein
MGEPKSAPGKTGGDRAFLGTVLIASLAGILYFGIQAVRENSRRNTDNPYAYDIEEYKSLDSEMIRYSEAPPLRPGLEHLTALAVGGDDRIYAAGDGGVTVFTSSGRKAGFHAMSGTPRCLAVDVNGDLYAGLGDHIAVFDREGKQKALWESPSEAAIFTSIALADEYVFAADAGTKVVWRMDRSGLNPIRIGDRNPDKDIPGFVIPSPYFDVAVDGDGFLWAANTGRHSLENYNFDGDLRASWGEFSMDIGGFCGCCNPTHFALLEDGSFVTSEKGIPRVKITNRAGLPAAVVAGPDQFAEGTVGLDLAVDSGGRILVLDPVRKAVRIFIEKKGEEKRP